MTEVILRQPVLMSNWQAPERSRLTTSSKRQMRAKKFNWCPVSPPHLMKKSLSTIWPKGFFDFRSSFYEFKFLCRGIGRIFFA